MAFFYSTSSVLWALIKKKGFCRFLFVWTFLKTWCQQKFCGCCRRCCHSISMYRHAHTRSVRVWTHTYDMFWCCFNVCQLIHLNVNIILNPIIQIVWFALSSYSPKRRKENEKKSQFNSIKSIKHFAQWTLGKRFTNILAVFFLPFVLYLFCTEFGPSALY